MNKIVTNLKLRSDCLDITEKTLLLLADLAGGYSSGELQRPHSGEGGGRGGDCCYCSRIWLYRRGTDRIWDARRMRSLYRG
jgi:hypothetical protein